MLRVLTTVATVFLENDFVLVLNFVFTGHIVSVTANCADKTKFNSNVFLSHVGGL